MKKAIVLLLGFVLCQFLPGLIWAQQSTPEQRIKSFEKSLTMLTPGPAGAPKTQGLLERMAFYKVPGVSIAVINGNKIEWAKGYGVCKAGGGVAVTPDTLFEAASTTKAVVAAAILHYVEQKRFNLDADVNTYLKTWKIAESEFTKDQKVTLRLLLSHRGGMPSTNMGFDEQAGVPTLIQVLKGEAPAKNKAAVVEYEPGSKWQYSNIGYVVLQLILEDSLGEPLPRILERTIFAPLGMKSSTLTYPLPTALQAREALPHDNKGQPGTPSMHPSALAQGGLMSTPADLARFLIGLMRPTRDRASSLLSPAMIQAMFHAEVDLDPKMTGFPFPLSDGLGMFVKGSGPALTVLHPGNNYPGSLCWLLGFPEKGQGVAIMLNGNGGDDLAGEIIITLTGIYGWPQLL